MYLVSKVLTALHPLPGRLGRGVSIQQPLCTHFGSHGDRALDNVTVISDHSQYNCWHQHSITAGTLPECEDGESDTSVPEIQDCRQRGQHSRRLCFSEANWAGIREVLGAHTQRCKDFKGKELGVMVDSGLKEAQPRTY